MAEYDAAPLTAMDADMREEKRLKKERNAAQEKSVAYSRLVSSKDFAEFLGALSAILSDIPRGRPMSDYEQGRLSAWFDIVNELNYAAGAAKILSDITKKRHEAAHKDKVFLMEQKGE